MGTHPTNSMEFWTVMVPTDYTQNVKDIAIPCDPFQFADMARSGLSPDQVHGFFPDQEQAIKEARELLFGRYNEAKSLEEKKMEVTTKLQKRMGDLQKMAETHMKSMKTDPENAEGHQLKAEGLMAKIKELRERHKMVEGSKKELKEMNYDESGLKDPKKAVEKTVKTEAVTKPVGKTKSGKDIYVDFDNPGHKDFTAADHDDASTALLTVKSKGTLSKNTVSPIKKKAAAQHFNASKAKQKK